MSRYCSDALTEVNSYLDKELSWISAWRVRRHLKGCSPCDAAYGFEEKLRIVIRVRLREEAPQEFLSRLRSAIDQERGSAQGPQGP
jgi:mycothiol system anti-sigma-R factor